MSRRTTKQRRAASVRTMYAKMLAYFRLADSRAPEMWITEQPCHHLDVRPCHYRADGSVYGRCRSCGDDTFPIRDVGYEEFLSTPEGRYKCSLQVMAENPGMTYPEALQKALAAELAEAEHRVKEVKP